MLDISFINLERRSARTIPTRLLPRNKIVAQVIVHPVVVLAVEEEEPRRDRLLAARRVDRVPERLVPLVRADVLELRPAQVHRLPEPVAALEPLCQRRRGGRAEAEKAVPEEAERRLGQEKQQPAEDAVQVLLDAREVAALLQGRDLEAAGGAGNVADGGEEQKTLAELELWLGIERMAVHCLYDNVGADGMADEDNRVVGLVLVGAVALCRDVGPDALNLALQFKRQIFRAERLVITVVEAEKIAAVDVVGRVVLRLVQHGTETTEEVIVKFNHARVAWDKVD